MLVSALSTVPAAELLYDTGVNLLAHALLANSDPDRIVGQLCGDFVRGTDLGRFPPGVQAGIRCHRAVDTFTDRHPLNVAARNLFESPHRRFAGIAIDVLYDHFLATAWHRYSEVSFKDYTDLVNSSLDLHFQVLPPGLQRFRQLLETEDTLQRNLTREHIELTLQRIASRRRSLSPLASIAPLVWEWESDLKSAFEDFFPELLSYTRDYQQTLDVEKLQKMNVSQGD